MNEHEDKKLTDDQLQAIRDAYAGQPMIARLLGHIDYLDTELTTKSQYFEEYLLPMIEEEQGKEREGWRKRLEGARAEARRPNPMGIEPGR